ncbi:hypothetical protein QUF72_07605 [Desulfobacterales bacterium HSG2]|nr:hypothetical protein [Desulfobacterales bacterium HSG2]
MAKTPKTRWHRLLGRLLEELLIPVGIKVFTELEVMGQSAEGGYSVAEKDAAKMDPRSTGTPDGIRDSSADHILLEFKYSESVGLSAFRQAVGYDAGQIRLFSDEQGRRVSESASVTGIGYPADPERELSEEPHNAYIKCFADRRQEKRAAFRILKAQNIGSFSVKLLWFLQGLWKHRFSKGGAPMKQELTPEQVIEMGKKC